ncbi:hypothetical protein H9Y05_13070 [Crocinitomicaceae bacterium CZZ-1]|uniref:Tetratricopeptide repeat protein n=1 Tax=Taishania pollutisoli TaxID=2766479 RepID=A0A8J6U0M1_9FLAO|nr:tetratricopeptide repeat protein [Taishania pollutisoli]MBC9813403.1 hypothetical protein [Taishania pollutisoli]NGF76572.1 hypothetical protein [Fluviicola sp. SGL-29]
MKFLFIALATSLTMLSSCNLTSTNDAMDLNEKGLALSQQREYQQAIALFIKAADTKGISNSNKSEFLRNAAIAYAESMVADSARYYYMKAATANPKDVYQYNVNMADVHIIDEKYADALTCLEKAWAVNSNEVAVNNSLGLLYLGEYDPEIFDPAKALKYNLKAHQINNDRSTKYVLAKNYYQMADFDNCERLFDELHRDFPDDSEYLMSLIVVSEEKGELDKADAYLKQLQVNHPEDYKFFMEEE